MMYNFPALGSWTPFGPWILLLSLVDVVLRGIALWRSARSNQQYWFIALLVVNSLGVLPLIYLLVQKNKTTVKTSNARKKTNR